MLSLALLLITSPIQSQDSIQGSIAKIISATEKPFTTDREGYDRDAAVKEYDEAFKSLSVALPTSSTAELGHISGLSKELIEIAKDRSKRPAKYEEIRFAYFDHISSPLSHAQESLHLKKTHEGSDYRLPMEYFLLRPISNPPFSWNRALEALSSSYEPSTVPLFVEVFRLRSLYPEYRSGGEGCAMLSVLMRKPSVKSLQGLADCIDLYRPFANYFAQQPDSSGYEWEPTHFIHENVWKAKDKNATDWQTFLHDVKPEDLTTTSARRLATKLSSPVLQDGGE